MDPPEPERKAASEKGRDASEQNNLSIAIHLKRNNLDLAVGETLLVRKLSTLT